MTFARTARSNISTAVRMMAMKETDACELLSLDLEVADHPDAERESC